MKTKIVLKGLSSGRVQLTPEILAVLEQQRDFALSAVSDRGDAASMVKPAAQPDAHAGQSGVKRMIFASPLPGRWIRCLGLLAVCACLSQPLLVRAAGTESTFDEANRVFAEGRMSAAARGFESVIARDGYSAPALFNLANAQLRDGQIGPAILNYERAQWLAPRDPDIAANLDFARRKAGLPVPAESKFHALLSGLSLGSWSGMLAVSLLALAMVPVLRRLFPAYRLAVASAAVGTAVLAVLATVGTVGRMPDMHRGVIVSKEAPARLSPVTVVPAEFVLRAGETVTLKRAHGQFVLVATSQGREGWVSRDLVEPVVVGGVAQRATRASGT